MNIHLIFPPAFDFAMPYLALPLLKSYILKNNNFSTVKCVDLNLDFFRTSIPNYSEFLQNFRTSVNDSDDINYVVNESIKFQAEISKSLALLSNKYPDDKWTLRNHTSSKNKYNFQECMDYSTINSPYDHTFKNYLANHKQPRVCGISITATDQVLPAFRLASLIRSNWEDTVIVLGGSLATRIGQFMSSQELSVLFDYCIVREGEIAFSNLINHLHNNNCEIIDSRIINLKKGSKIPSLLELDSLSPENHLDLNVSYNPDFSDLDIHEYLSPVTVLPILTSRKCYWGRCNFCAIHASWDNSKRQRKAKDVFLEMRTLHEKYNVNFFRIVDEACPPNIIKEVAELIINSGIQVNFEIYGILEKRYLKDDFIYKLSKAGCRQIFFGLETTKASTLKDMNKTINQTGSNLKEILKKCANNNIHNYVFSLFGYPNAEDSEDETIEYIKSEKNIHTVVIGSYLPDLGSPFGYKFKKQLYHKGDMTENFKQFTSIKGITITTQDMGSDKAKKAQQIIYKNRKDLMLAMFFYDELRLFLISKFGATFSREVSLEKEIENIVLNTVLKTESDERIQRSVT